MRLISFLLLILASPLLLPAQSRISPQSFQEGPALPRDPKAEELVELGKLFMVNRDFDRAARAFDAAINRPEHQLYSLSLYMAGLAHYYRNDDATALQRFNLLIERYALSHYRDEARYHRALIFLRSADVTTKHLGLNEMFAVSEQASRQDLAWEAGLALRYCLAYLLDSETVVSYFGTAPGYRQAVFTEALCMGYLSRGQTQQAIDLYRRYLDDGGYASAYLLRAFRAYRPGSDPAVSKVALVMPFMTQVETAGNPRAVSQRKIAVEFYEGFRLALEEYAPIARRKLLLRVFDSRRDSATLSRQLIRIDSFAPDLVVGDAFNDQSLMLSEWSELFGVPQLVPFSPTLSLERKQSLFMCRPATGTHGQIMGRHADAALRLRKVAVISDGRTSSELLCKGFSESFGAGGARIVPIRVDSVFSKAKSQLLSQLKAAVAQGIDGIYSGSGSESLNGLVLTELRALSQDSIVVMGGPNWQSFKAIDTDLKERFRVHFSTTNTNANDSAAYALLFTKIAQTYNMAPSEYQITGYDLGRYVALVLDTYPAGPGDSLEAYLRRAPRWRGIHLDYEFAGSQSNRHVNIVVFGKGGFRLVK